VNNPGEGKGLQRRRKALRGLMTHPRGTIRSVTTQGPHAFHHRAGVVALALVGAWLLIDPRGVVALLVALVVVAMVVAGLTGIVIARSMWRMVTRPVGRLTVLDFAVGAAAWRWWRRHLASPRHSMPPPSRS